uniref:Uncharacterized protein n=1 Tax=Photinus pyralis TaxID=7054 RepID=A0A1Y1LJ88_PHOPY
MDNISLIIKKLEDLDSKNEEFQRKVMRNQYALQHKLNDLERVISESANIRKSNINQVTDEESEQVLSIWKLFPLDSVQALEDVENSLADQQLQQHLVGRCTIQT